jgi:hypothetical protein
VIDTLKKKKKRKAKFTFAALMNFASFKTNILMYFVTKTTTFRVKLSISWPIQITVR